MPTPFFADLVRELAQEGGTGPLTPTGAVPGHRRFAGAVPPDTSFHYAIAGIARPEQWEVGTGRIDVSGRLVRDSVAASSAGGARVDFAVGLKTLALTVGAGWFAASDTAAASTGAALTALETGLAAGLAAKQPLSTGHASVGSGAADDLVTVRRGGGWVNLPLQAFAFREASGRVIANGPLGGTDGSAAAPSLSFASDPDSGIFAAAADSVAIATAGTEKMRVVSGGNVGIGTQSPAARLHVHGSAKIGQGAASPAQTLLINTPNGSSPGIQLFQDGVESWVIQNPAASTVLRFANSGTNRLSITGGGALLPGADNAQTIGDASFRWSVVYAATGSINTSDLTQKKWLGGLTADELRAARRIGADIGRFQWLDAIARKGEAAARVHVGVGAQSVWAIMAEEGLVDAIGADGVPGHTPYAFLCWDQGEAAGGGRFGVRPDQLALFLIAAQEARIAAQEAAA